MSSTKDYLNHISTTQLPNRHLTVFDFSLWRLSIIFG